MNRTNLFTTGQVAAILGVAPRTAAKLIDSGRIVGWRIPDCGDRRVTRDALTAFLAEHRIPSQRPELLDFKPGRPGTVDQGPMDHGEHAEPAASH